MVAAIASSAISAAGTVMSGMEADASSKVMQQQHKQQASTERAISQRQALKDREEASLAESRGLALAAASGGGGVETPGVADLIAGINTEGEMRAKTSLWEGEERGRGLEYAGKVARWQGKQAKKASYLQAGSTLLSGVASAGSFMGKYGGGAPSPTPGFAGVGAQPY